jgi:hypothetical protein
VNLNDFYEQKNSIKALGFTLEVKLWLNYINFYPKYYLKPNFKILYLQF